jgi:hypothetical protein
MGPDVGGMGGTTARKRAGATVPHVFSFDGDLITLRGPDPLTHVTLRGPDPLTHATPR